MKLRFILRDGQRILQQAKPCAVLLTDTWEDVPLELDFKLYPDAAHAPSGGLSMDRIEGHDASHEKNSVSIPGHIYSAGNWDEKEAVRAETRTYDYRGKPFAITVD